MIAQISCDLNYLLNDLSSSLLGLSDYTIKAVSRVVSYILLIRSPVSQEPYRIELVYIIVLQNLKLGSFYAILHLQRLLG